MSLLEVSNEDGEAIEVDAAFQLLCEITSALTRSTGRQFLVGNGASAAFANHMALDWTKNGGVVTQSFSDSAMLTALANDLSYEDAFSTGLEWYAKSNDLLVTISSSGNSPNIIKAINKAREIGMRVVTLSGLKPDNNSRKLGDINLYIPAKTYGIVECAHQVLLHVWLDKHMGISEWDRDDCQNMNRDEFKL